MRTFIDYSKLDIEFFTHHRRELKFLVSIVLLIALMKISVFHKPKLLYYTDTIKDMVRIKDNALKHINILTFRGGFYRAMRNLTNNTIIKEKKAYLDFFCRIYIWREMRNLNVYNKSKTYSLPDHLNNVDFINTMLILLIILLLNQQF